MTGKSAKSSAAAEPQEEQMVRLRRAMDAASEMDRGEGLPPESRRVRRDAQGRLLHRPRGLICEAILRELGRREMTRYELWKQARHLCPTLPESAVYEFLRGQRQIGVDYLEALLQALDFVVVPASHGHLARAKAG